MTRGGLPDNVYNFVLEHIDSLEQLEVLLLMRKLARESTAEEVARELRVGAESVANRLAGLHQRGILTSPSGKQYLYAPTSPEMMKDVTDLAQAYVERRVSVINLIATKHLERIKSFADAFKFKGKP